MKFFRWLSKMLHRPARTGHFELVQHYEEPYTGNPHFNYASRVKRLDAMYRGTAQWGCAIAQAVVDLRSNFTIGAGINVFMRQSGAERELTFINEFLKFNCLDLGQMQSWAAEAEIDGKFLVTLNPNPRKRTIDASHWTRAQGSYVVLTSAETPSHPVAVEYTHDGLIGRIPPDRFIFRTFGGYEHDVNESQSKACAVVEQFENYDRIVADMRKIGHAFASPTAYFKTENPYEARDIAATLKNSNWKPGKYLVGSADFKIVESSGAESKSLGLELDGIIRLISGATGVPPHFLGHPELVCGDGTADSLVDLLKAATLRERMKWTDFYMALFRRAIDLANEGWQAGFNRDAIGCSFLSCGSSMLQETFENWMPLYMDGAITLRAFLSKFPEINVESELKELKQGGRV